jgi:hypothetical protein
MICFIQSKKYEKKHDQMIAAFAAPLSFILFTIQIYILFTGIEIERAIQPSKETREILYQFVIFSSIFYFCFGVLADRQVNNCIGQWLVFFCIISGIVSFLSLIMCTYSHFFQLGLFIPISKLQYLYFLHFIALSCLCMIYFFYLIARKWNQLSKTNSTPAHTI